MNKEFFRGMKELIEPDEEQVEELKNKLKNTAAVSRKPMWIGGVCAAALCVAVGAGLFLSDSKTDKNSIKTSGSSSVQTVHMIQRSTTARQTIRIIQTTIRVEIRT